MRIPKIFNLKTAQNVRDYRSELENDKGNWYEAIGADPSLFKVNTIAIAKKNSMIQQVMNNSRLDSAMQHAMKDLIELVFEKLSNKSFRDNYNEKLVGALKPSATVELIRPVFPIPMSPYTDGGEKSQLGSSSPRRKGTKALNLVLNLDQLLPERKNVGGWQRSSSEMFGTYNNEAKTIQHEGVVKYLKFGKKFNDSAQDTVTAGDLLSSLKNKYSEIAAEKKSGFFGFFKPHADFMDNAIKDALKSKLISTDQLKKGLNDVQKLQVFVVYGTKHSDCTSGQALRAVCGDPRLAYEAVQRSPISNK